MDPVNAGAFARLRALRLHPDWRRTLKHAWSVRLIALSILLSGLESVCGVFTDDPPIPRKVFAFVTFVITVGALAARFALQRNLMEE